MMTYPRLDKDGNLDPRYLMGNEQELENSKSQFVQPGAGDMLKAYLDEEVPFDIRKTDLYQQFWAATGHTLQLTFIREDDIEYFEYLWRISKINFLMSVPSYKIRTKELQLLNQLHIHFIAAIRRSVGSKTHITNERTAQQSSIQQVIRSNVEDIRAAPGPPQKGFFARMLGG